MHLAEAHNVEDDGTNTRPIEPAQSVLLRELLAVRGGIPKAEQIRDQLNNARVHNRLTRAFADRAICQLRVIRPNT